MNDTVVAFETIVSDTIASEWEALGSRELESHHTADINVYTDNLHISSSVTSAYYWKWELLYSMFHRSLLPHVRSLRSFGFALRSHQSDW